MASSGRNLQHVFKGLRKFIVFDGISLSVFNVLYNNGMNSTKTVLKVY